MPNLDLKNKKFKITNDIVKKYFNDNEMVSYEYLNKVKSELNNKKNKTKDDNTALKWVEKTLKQASDAVDRPKRIIMQTGGKGGKKGGNAFKDTHTKDRNNKNVGKIRLPKIYKGSVRRKIMTNKVQYESINEELDTILYLIEYLNNK
jgi:hypothetical protein